MMKVVATLAVLVLAISLYGVESAVFQDLPLVEKVYGRRVFYCEYKGFRILPYSKIKNYDDCTVCRCRRSGLSCATLLPLITSEIPDDSECMPINVACKQKWVIRAKPWKKCPADSMPDNLSMVGK